MSALNSSYNLWFGGRDGHLVELTAGRHFRLYPFGIGRGIGEAVPPRLVDLVRIGMAAYVVDGLIRRPRHSGGFRSIALKLEVLDHAFWSGFAAGVLKECLDFVTGDDDWQIEPVPGPPSPRECHPSLPFSSPTTVCLYSGGLDSAAGLAVRLRDSPENIFIPVTIRHQFNQVRLVTKQFDHIRQHYAPDRWRIRPVAIGAFVRDRQLQRERGIKVRENTHRCRAFLFAALGGVVAVLDGSDRVELYESGVGAVNLPLMAGMTGWKTTRSSHPHFLHLVGHLLSLIAERPVTFKLPFRDCTKAEMVSGLASLGLTDLARETASCVKYPLRHKNRKQCGVCPACVFRRQALMYAGIEEPATIYKYDLFGTEADFAAIPPKRLRVLKAFLMQATRLAQLNGENIHAPFRRHMLGTRLADTLADSVFFVRLLRRYGREWIALGERGRTCGWPWADWLAPKHPITVR